MKTESRPDREHQFLTLWRLFGGAADPERQRRFSPPRRWRFDFCWPDRMVAVEIQGGHWSGGRHVRGKGYQSDCEKHNAAMLLGWRLLYFTSDDLDRRPAAVVAQVKALLCAK